MSTYTSQIPLRSPQGCIFSADSGKAVDPAMQSSQSFRKWQCLQSPRRCHPERSAPARSRRICGSEMMAEPADRRSFDSAPRDKAARSSAQDDTSRGALEETGSRLSAAVCLTCSTRPGSVSFSRSHCASFPPIDLPSPQLQQIRLIMQSRYVYTLADRSVAGVVGTEALDQPCAARVAITPQPGIPAAAGLAGCRQRASFADLDSCEVSPAHASVPLMCSAVAAGADFRSVRLVTLDSEKGPDRITSP
jgi:hypothetical protein